MDGTELVRKLAESSGGHADKGLQQKYAQSIMGATENRLTTVSMGLAAFSGVSGGIRKSLGYY